MSNFNEGPDSAGRKTSENVSAAHFGDYRNVIRLIKSKSIPNMFARNKNRLMERPRRRRLRRRRRVAVPGPRQEHYQTFWFFLLWRFYLGLCGIHLSKKQCRCNKTALVVSSHCSFSCRPCYHRHLIAPASALTLHFIYISSAARALPPIRNSLRKCCYCKLQQQGSSRPPRGPSSVCRVLHCLLRGHFSARARREWWILFPACFITT